MSYCYVSKNIVSGEIGNAVCLKVHRECDDKELSIAFSSTIGNLDTITAIVFNFSQHTIENPKSILAHMVIDSSEMLAETITKFVEGKSFRD